MRLKWMNTRDSELYKGNLLVVFKDQESSEEKFNLLPSFMSNIRHEGLCILFIRLQDGRFIWQMFEVVKSKEQSRSEQPGFGLKLVEQFLASERMLASIFWYQMLRMSLLKQSDQLIF